MKLPDDLLARPAGDGARLVVLALLNDAHHAAQRLQAPDDEEALHDFRVAIRRTRAALESWADLLPKKARKLRKELTRIQRATGAARDAEVALEWLATTRSDVGPDVTRAIDFLSSMLEAERAASLDLEPLGVGFEEVRHQLVERVRITRHDLLAESRESTFAEAVAVQMEARFDELVELLTGVTGPQDVEVMHQARIAGKGLRYLIEPVADREPMASELLSRLKGLQDLLGELHDAHVLADRIAIFRIDVDEFSLRTSIDSVRARTISRSVGLHRRLVEEWLEKGLDELRPAIDRLAQALAAHGGIEIERKYLLSSLPSLPSGAEAIEIEQGYLPGRRLRERVRCVRRNGSAQYYRTIKMGAGVQRIEVEEETSAEIFSALWALTEGCRIRKRRYLVQDENLTWEVDQFLDRELVLLEVELTSPELKPSLPIWVQPHVVEDVTDRGEYTNLALAR